MNRRRLATTLIIVSLGLWRPRGTLAAENLVRNGDLSEGSGKVPGFWQTASQRRSHLQRHVFVGPSAGERRRAPPDQPQNPTSRTGLRRVSLPPGWYYLTGEIKATGDWSDVAMIGVHFHRHEFGFHPRAGSGGSSWTTGGLYFKIGGDRQSVQIVCQLEGGGSASFRHISLIPITGAPPAGATQFDLGSIAERPEPFRGADPNPFAPPTGRPWSIAALVLALTGITLWGWIALALPAPRRRDQS